MKKKLFSVILFLSLICMAVGCGGNGGNNVNKKESSLSFEQNSAIFTEDDLKIRPISTALPTENEMISKEVTVNFENVSVVAFSFETQNDANTGLKFRIDNGAVRNFQNGVFFEKDVEEDQTQIAFKLSIWADVSTPIEMADSNFKFDIKVTATGLDGSEKQATNANNVVSFGGKMQYEWSTNAIKLFDGITYVVLDEVKEPIDLIEMFEESSITAEYTVDNVTTSVNDLRAFIPQDNGVLTISVSKIWCESVEKQINVEIDMQYSVVNYDVSFKVEYPSWYKESDVIQVKAQTTDMKNQYTKTAVYDEQNDQYLIKLPSGSYNVNVESLTFKKDASNNGYLFEQFIVNDSDANLSEEVLKFNLLRLANESKVVYSENGFTIPSANTIFYPTKNVVAKEGFVISYNFKTTTANDKWINGGFAFKVGNKWYSLLVYTRKSGASSAFRIALNEQTESSSNMCAWAHVCYLTTQLIPASSSLNQNDVDITIAYYEDSFYVQIGDAYAVKVCKQLFADENKKVALDKWPVFFDSTSDDNNNQANRNTFKNSSFFNAGERILGFRTIDFENTFSNFKFYLSNEDAQNAIKQMRIIAEDMQYEIPSITKWPEFSDLDDYEWGSQAKDYANNGIDYTYDGLTVMDLKQMFNEASLTATYNVEGTITEVTDATKFMPTESGILSVVPHVSGKAKTVLQVNVNVKLIPKYKFTFAVQYPAWYNESGDVVSVSATNTISQTTTNLQVLNGAKANEYYVELVNGNYDLSINSLRFVGSNITNLVVNDANQTAEQTINFTTPKLGNETGVTYNSTGFVVPRGNTQFRPLANVVATEGFVVSYEMATEKVGSADVWYNGGFVFKMANRWYSLVVYTRKNIATTIRIGLTDQVERTANESVFEGNEPCFLTTPIALTSEQLAKLQVTIAYYDGSYYVQVFNYAFKVSSVLFDNSKSASDNWPIYFNSTLSDKNDTTRQAKYNSTSTTKYYAEGDRTLGFRAIDGKNTFTNVQYSLGNQSAIDCIKEMRKFAELMDYEIPSENAWHSFSDLPDYVWNSQAQEYITNGISYEYDGVNTLNLTEIFGLQSLKVSYEVDGGDTTQVTNLTAFMPLESGMLTIYPNCLGYTNKPIQVQVTATNILVPRKVTFKVAYPNWYGESGDTITAVALNTLSQTSENLTVTTQDGNYVVELLKGSYELTVTSTRFKDVKVDVTVVNQDQTLANSVQFTTPKLSNETGITYNATGFVVPANKTVILSNVSASEGFVVRFTVNVTNSGTTWFAGGFGFTMGGKTYGIGVYTRKDSAGSLRIGLHDSDVWQTNNENGPAFLSTLCSVTAEEIANLNVEIAYYGGNYYVKVQNKYAFRICPELFANRVAKGNEPIYFAGDDTTANYSDNNNLSQNKDTFFNSSSKNIYKAGTRNLGFKTYQGTSTFTNVEYKLGNQYALDAIYGVDGVSGMYGVMLAMKNASAQDFTYTEQTKWPAKPSNN